VSGKFENKIIQGISQRTAHGIVGRLVRLAIERNVPLAKLSLNDFRNEYGGFDNSVFSILGAENAVSAIKSVTVHDFP